MTFPVKCCINDVNFIRLLLLSTELFKFEIQKYGQIFCVHKPYFLMRGHFKIIEHDIYILVQINTTTDDCSLTTKIHTDMS